MTLQYVIYGLCFGWLLMPRWKNQNLKTPVSVIAYTVAVVTGLAIAYYFEYDRRAWVFTMGMAIQLAITAVARWGKYFIGSVGRKFGR